MLLFFSHVTQNALLLPLLLFVLGLAAFLSQENRGEDHRTVVCLCQTEVFVGRPLAEKEIRPIGMFICSSYGLHHPSSYPYEEQHLLHSICASQGDYELPLASLISLPFFSLL